MEHNKDIGELSHSKVNREMKNGLNIYEFGVI